MIVGKVRSGKIRKGERVKLLSPGIKTEISLILRHGESVDTAECGDLIRFRLDRMYKYDASIRPGDIIAVDENLEKERERKEVPFRMRFGATIRVKQYEMKDSSHCLKRILVQKVNVQDNVESSLSFDGLIKCGKMKVGERVESMRTGKRGQIETIKTMGHWFGTPQRTTEVNSTKNFARIMFTVVSEEDGFGKRIPMELRSGDILLVFKEDIPSPRMYPIEFETNRPFKFTVFLGNSMAKCLTGCIRISDISKSTRICIQKVTKS